MTNVCAKTFIIYVTVAVPAPNVLAADVFATAIIHRLVLLTQYCAGDKIEKNEMGWACGAYG